MPGVSAKRARRGHLRAAILLLLQDGESHGYELMARTSELELDHYLNTGSVYQTLRRLAAEGLVSSCWNMPERGPARRVYILTDEGRTHLEVSMPELSELTAAVSKLPLSRPTQRRSSRSQPLSTSRISGSPVSSVAR